MLKLDFYSHENENHTLDASNLSSIRDAVVNINKESCFEINERRKLDFTQYHLFEKVQKKRAFSIKCHDHLLLIISKSQYFLDILLKASKVEVIMNKENQTFF